MQTTDLTPLYRTMVGFDRMASMIDAASRLDGTQGYPPYNIEKTADDEFRIELAVAGFSEADLELEINDGILTVTGKKEQSTDTSEREFLHRGIAERSFLRRFQLADHIIVTGAALEHGILRVDLVRELPEALKPRKIAIGETSAKGKKSKPAVIEGSKSAA